MAAIHRSKRSTVAGITAALCRAGYWRLAQTRCKADPALIQDGVLRLHHSGSPQPKMKLAHDRRLTGGECPPHRPDRHLAWSFSIARPRYRGQAHPTAVIRHLRRSRRTLVQARSTSALPAQRSFFMARPTPPFQISFARDLDNLLTRLERPAPDSCFSVKEGHWFSPAASHAHTLDHLRVPQDSPLKVVQNIGTIASFVLLTHATLQAARRHAAAHQGEQRWESSTEK